jgi:oligopeptide/dipeptide ABC transporter ATP-binding protein
VLLLQAVPVPDPAVNQERRRDQLPLALGGGAPSRGCVFSTRCEFAKDECRKSSPPYTDVASGHKVRCWFPGVASSQRGGPRRDATGLVEVPQGLAHLRQGPRAWPGSACRGR